MDAKTLYEERITRFDNVLNRKKVDRVPIIPNMSTWMYHYAGVSIKEAFVGSPQAIIQAGKKLVDNIPMDCLMSTSNTLPITMAEKFGQGIYVVSDNGVQIKGSGGHLMEPEEYDLLAEDPLKFFANVLIPRKFKILDGMPFEDKVKMFKAAYNDNTEYGKYNREANSGIEALGLPIIVKATTYLSPDVVLDYLRDFVGISLDVRRCPDKLLAACEALYDVILGMFRETATPPDRKILFSPLHVPTYLRPKDFEKLYFPFMKKYLQEIVVEKGYNAYFFMENDWMPYLDILQDLPTSSKFLGLVETGDLPEIKRCIGHKMILMGGMPVELLSLGTKEQVIDKSKELLDTLAPGGGYVFSTNKTMLTPSDGKAENLIAACEYIAENGKY